MLAKIKTLLRITNSAYDAEITDLIAAATADLVLSGVLESKATDDTDALIVRAISTYCKANFGWDNPASEKLQVSYEMLKKHLTMSRDYAFYKITFDVGVRATITLGDTEKETNADGEVEFYSRFKNNVTYIVRAEGYETETDEIDIKENTTITLVLTGV